MLGKRSALVTNEGRIKRGGFGIMGEFRNDWEARQREIATKGPQIRAAVDNAFGNKEQPEDTLRREEIENQTTPSSIPVAEIRLPHPDYNGQKLIDYEALYRGGDLFHSKIDDFLVKRKIEEINHDFYLDRKKYAWYIPRAGGLIDWVVASVFKDDPFVEVEKGKDTTKKYWEDFNGGDGKAGVDGKGTPFSALMRQILLQDLMHNRSAFAVFSEFSFDDEENLKSVPRARSVSAGEFDNWERNRNDDYEWIRLHTVEEKRVNFWDAKFRIFDFWEYHFPTSRLLYKHERTGQNEFATLVGTFSHDFGQIPIFAVESRHELWVMDKISDPAIALFNREVSIHYGLDKLAYPILGITTAGGEEVEKIVDGTIGGLVFKDRDSGAGYVEINPQAFDSLFKHQERLKESIFEVMQALAVSALAMQTQNARQSGTAKILDQGPVEILLRSFSWPVIVAAQKMIDAINDFLGDPDAIVTIEGTEPAEITEDMMADQVLGTSKKTVDGQNQGLTNGKDAVNK